MRIDINFGTFRNSGEFINDEELPEADSSVGCRLVIHNHSRQDVVLDGDSFSNYLNYEVIDMETGEPVPCLSPTPVSREVSPFMLKPDSGLEFLVRYGAYWCFFGIGTDDDDVVYEMPGRFKIYHELIPNDFTIFSVSRDGIVMQEMDLKIYDFHE